MSFTFGKLKLYRNAYLVVTAGVEFARRHDVRQGAEAMEQHGEELDDQSADQIVAFLHSLTGTLPDVTYPVLPAETATTPRPSGEVLAQ